MLQTQLKEMKAKNKLKKDDLHERMNKMEELMKESRNQILELRTENAELRKKDSDLEDSGAFWACLVVRQVITEASEILEQGMLFTIILLLVVGAKVAAKILDWKAKVNSNVAHPNISKIPMNELQALYDLLY